MQRRKRKRAAKNKSFEEVVIVQETDRLLPPGIVVAGGHSSSSSSPPPSSLFSFSSVYPPYLRNPALHYSSIGIIHNNNTNSTMMKDEEAGDEEIVSLVSGADGAAASAASAAAIANGDANGNNKTQSPARRRPRRPMDQIRTGGVRGNEEDQAPPSLMLRLTCLSVLTLVVLGSMGLLTYIQDGSAKAPVYEFIPGLDGGINTSDDEVIETAQDILAKNQAQGGIGGGSGTSMLDKDALQVLMKEAGMAENPRGRSTTHKVHYNPQWTQHNPFDFDDRDVGPNPMAPLFLAASNADVDATHDVDAQTLGYLQMPHLVNNHLVFCSQGDAFLTTVQPQKLKQQQGQPQHQLQPLPAAKLTTTVGNVIDPRLHPKLRYLAYTATYSGRRDIYLLDLQGGRPAVRLTYWDSSVGVSGLIGWWGDSALVFQAHSNQVSLPDTRLYVLHLEDNDGDDHGSLAAKTNHTHDRRIRALEDLPAEEMARVEPTKSPPPPPVSSSSSRTQNPRTVSMLQIDPIPLSQARDAARHGECWYFVRISQTSHTIRYVGGTAEQLYRYCDKAQQADRLLFQDRYNGTSKAPQIYANSDYLFFLSDRSFKSDGSWKPDRMNVWALPLSDNLKDHTHDALIQITDTACDFEGRVLQDYSIDSTTGHMVVRIGADLYWMTAEDIQAKLKNASSNNKNNNNINNNNNKKTMNREKGRQLVAEEEEPDWILPGDTPENGTLADVVDDNVTEVAEELDVEEDILDVEGTLDEDILDEVGLIGNETLTNETLVVNETVNKVFYHYEPPAMESRLAEDATTDHFTGTSTELTRLPIVVHSDFHTHQERIIPVDLLTHLSSADIYETAYGTLQFVMTLRGQLWVAPIEEDSDTQYKGSGRNMPGRRYRVAPGAAMGGVVRILTVRHVPNPVEDDTSDRRLAVILATDPLTETAEQAFYLIETQSSATPLFLDMEHLPKPFLGGHVSGGSAKEGGLGSVEADSVTVSPCGRRMAWTDRDGRILVMNLPHYQNMTNDNEVPEVVVLPKENEIGQPMVGEEASFTFSPGGRYLAVEHNARNQFSVISIVDLGDPQGDDKVADIEVGRIVQATPDRFNSADAYWGKSTADMHKYSRDSTVAKLLGDDPPEDVATTLYFLSDRDISSDVRSPWGTRQPMPHFKKQKSLFALPLSPKNATTTTETGEGPFSGGGAAELKVEAILARRRSITALLSATSSHRRGRLLQNSLAGAFGWADDAFTARRGRSLEEDRQEIQNAASPENITSSAEGEAEDETLRAATFPEDMDIDFGPVNDRSFTFARKAYRLATIPEAEYVSILSQTPDDGSFVLIAIQNDNAVVTVYLADDFPSDEYTSKIFSPTSRMLASYGRSTSGEYLYFGFSPDGQIRVAPNSGKGISQMLSDTQLDDNIVSGFGLHLSVWPSLEYRQLYDDAWRMLRDYFYDPEMTGIDWPAIHGRFLPLVSRCAKREELDDVLVQMASELSALHVFVYGGEYDSPMHGDRGLSMANDVASLGATFQRAPKYKGYRIMEIPEHDPDFGLIDGLIQIYSPLSDTTLRLSGQRGLRVGDVIVGVNGESVMKVPDIHMLLRGMAGNSVKLDVLRLVSGVTPDAESETEVSVESVITVPITSFAADDLRYFAWEWKTRQLAEKLASDNGFSVGYIHLQDMSGPEAEDAFAREFFPNYNKEAMILDVRHNRGGNIDSWVLDVLQRKPWMYWQSRDFNVDNGGLGWDEQFAFRGHLVVLIDEKTSSDGEGVSRGISELGLGRLIGTRTWGGGIWLASDNHLVDGGIATAPEIGTYNDNFGWGLGIEQMGVNPDIEVDNDPHQTYQGTDKQLETAILELKRWLDAEPIITPEPPQRKKDMTMGERECKR